MKRLERIKARWLRIKAINNEHIVGRRRKGNIDADNSNNHQRNEITVIQNGLEKSLSRENKTAEQKKPHEFMKFIIQTVLNIITIVVMIIVVNMENNANYKNMKEMIYKEHIPRFVFYRSIDCDDASGVYDTYGTYMLTEERLVEFDIDMVKQESGNKYSLYFTRKPSLRNINMKDNFEVILLSNAGEGSAFAINAKIDPTCTEYDYDIVLTSTQNLFSTDITSDFNGDYIEPVIQGENLAILLTCKQYDEAHTSCSFNITLTFQDLYGNPYEEKISVFYIPETGKFFYQSLFDFHNIAGDDLSN